jgi:hypothetical protein
MIKKLIYFRVIEQKAKSDNIIAELRAKLAESKIPKGFQSPTLPKQVCTYIQFKFKFISYHFKI